MLVAMNAIELGLDRQDRWERRRVASSPNGKR